MDTNCNGEVDDGDVMGMSKNDCYVCIIRGNWLLSRHPITVEDLEKGFLHCSFHRPVLSFSGTAQFTALQNEYLF